MTEELGFQESAKITRYEVLVNKDLRSPFLDDLEEIGRAHEIKEVKRIVMINRPYSVVLLYIN